MRAGEGSTQPNVASPTSESGSMLPLQLVAVRSAPVGAAESAALVDNGRYAMAGEVVEEELRAAGTTMFHCDLAQQVVFGRYTVPEGTTVGPGGSAAFVDFLLDGSDGGGSLPTRGLCIVTGRTLAVHTPASGAVHEIALPDAAFAACSGGPRLWPLDVGVLLAFPPTNGGGVGSSGEAYSSSSIGGGPPALYTLTQPLDALRPVRLPGGLSGSYFDATLSGFADTGAGFGGKEGAGNNSGGERVVWIGREPGWPLAVVLTRFASTSPGTAFTGFHRGNSSNRDGPANQNRLACWALRRERREGSDGDRYTRQKGRSWGGIHGGGGGDKHWSQGRSSSRAGLRDSRDTVVGLATESMVLDMKHESLLQSLGRSRQSMEHELSSTSFSRTSARRMAATTTRGSGANNATVRWGATLRAADTHRGPLTGHDDDDGDGDNDDVPLPPSSFRGSRSRFDSKSPTPFPGGASSVPNSPFQPVSSVHAAADVIETEQALLGTSPVVAHSSEAVPSGIYEPERSAESSMSVGGETPWKIGRDRGGRGSSGSEDFAATALLPEPAWGGHSPGGRYHSGVGGEGSPVGESGKGFGDTGLGRFTGRGWNDDGEEEGEEAGGLQGDSSPEPQFSLELVWTEEDASNHQNNPFGQTVVGGQGDEAGTGTAVGAGRVSPGFEGAFRPSSSSMFRGDGEGRTSSPQSGGGGLVSSTWPPEQVLVAETPRSDRGGMVENCEENDDDEDEKGEDDDEVEDWNVTSRPTLMLVDPAKGVLKAIGLAFHNINDVDGGGGDGGLNGFATGRFGRGGAGNVGDDGVSNIEPGSLAGGFGGADSQSAELRVRSTYLLKTLPRNDRSAHALSPSNNGGEASTGLAGKSNGRSLPLAARSAGTIEVSLAHSGLHVRPSRGSEQGRGPPTFTNNSSSGPPTERSKRMLLLLSAGGSGGVDQSKARGSASSGASPPVSAAELILSDGAAFTVPCALRCSARAVAAALSSAGAPSTSTYQGGGGSGQSSAFVPSALLAAELDAAAAADSYESSSSSSGGSAAEEGAQPKLIEQHQSASESMCALHPLRVLRSVGPYADVLCEVDETAWTAVEALLPQSIQAPLPSSSSSSSSSSVQQNVLGGSSARRLVARVRVSLCPASSVTADVLASLDLVLGRSNVFSTAVPSLFHPFSQGCGPRFFSGAPFFNGGADHRGWCVRSQALQLRAAVVARANALARAIAAASSSSLIGSASASNDSHTGTVQPGFEGLTPLEGELLATPGGSDCEWLALLQILAANFTLNESEAPMKAQDIAKEVNKNSSSSSSDSSSGASKRDAWAALLSSDYHRSYGSSQLDVFLPPLMPAEVPPKPTVQPSPASSSSSSSSSPAPNSAAASAAPPLISPAVAISAWDDSNAKACLWVLHLLYEDAKLDLSRAATTQASLGPLLEALSMRLGLLAYCHHYRRDRGAGDEAGSGSTSENGHLSSGNDCAVVPPASAWDASCTSLFALSAQGCDSTKKQAPSSLSNGDLPPEPPCVRSFLLAALARLSPERPTSMKPGLLPGAAPGAIAAAETGLANFPSLGDGYTCRTTQQVVSIYAALTGCFNHDENDHAGSSSCSAADGDFHPGKEAEKATTAGEGAEVPSVADIKTSKFMQQCVACVEALCHVGFSAQQLSLLPLGAQLPIREAIRACRVAPPPHWHASCYRIVRRDDLALLLGPHLPLEGTSKEATAGVEGKGPLNDNEEMEEDNDGGDDRNGNIVDDDDDVAMDSSPVVGRSPHVWPSPAAADSTPFTLVSPIAHQHDLASPGAASSVPPSSSGRRMQYSEPFSQRENATPFSKGAPRGRQLKSRGGSSGHGLSSGVGGSGGGSSSGVSYDGMASFPLIPELSGFGAEEADGPASSSGRSSSKWSSSLTGGDNNDDNDGLLALEAATEVRFSTDLRVRECCRLLQSSKPHVLRVPRPPEASDMDFIHLQQQRLLLLATRGLATSLGRGALTLGTLKPRAPLAEPLPVPHLCLRGRVPPKDASVRLDFNTLLAQHPPTSQVPPPSEKSLLGWPAFHNGVASGLRLASHGVGFLRAARLSGSSGSSGSGGTSSDGGGGASNGNRGSAGAAAVGSSSSLDLSGVNNNSSSSELGLGWTVTRNWIGYNAPSPPPGAAAVTGALPPPPVPTVPTDRSSAEAVAEEAKSAHGGLLLALGLQGHLEVLQKPDLYRYLKDGHEATTVGLLLGMACQYVGKADPTTNLIVRMHIPDTYDPALGASVGAEVTPACQAAALASLGLLYAASNHRQIADFLVNELGQRPQGDQVEDREAHALSAGFALGLVTLAAGHHAGEAGHSAENSSSDDNFNSSDARGGNDEDGGGVVGVGISGIGGGVGNNNNTTTNTNNSGSNGSGGGPRSGSPGSLMLEQRLHRLVVGGRTSDESNSGGSSSAANSGNNNSSINNSSRVFEGPFVNTSVTAPGATLALALCFMQTNDEAVAARLALPDTHPLLDYVRPDLTMQRVTARALVLWDSVEPSPDWCLAQVPQMVQDAWNQLGAPPPTALSPLAGVGGSSGGGGDGRGPLSPRNRPVDNESLLNQSLGSDYFARGGSGLGNTTSEDNDDDDDDEDNLLSKAELDHLLNPEANSVAVETERKLSALLDGDFSNLDSLVPDNFVPSAEAQAAAAAALSSPNSGAPAPEPPSVGAPSPSMSIPTKPPPPPPPAAAAAAAASSVSAFVDEASVKSVHAHALAGAVLGVGLRFAGTADPRAKATCLLVLRHFQGLRDGTPHPDACIGPYGCGKASVAFGDASNDGGANGVKVGAMFGAGAAKAARLAAQKPDRPALEMCLGAAAMSLGLVLAGTGDLEALTLIRALRAKVDAEVSYGHSMACHMALGLLFLGGGSLTVGRQPLQLACLAMATWPRWPRHPGDHQHHLQPLRHLYVLAAEPRSLKALDADTGLPVFVPVTVTLDTSAQGSKHRDDNSSSDSNSRSNGDHQMDDDNSAKMMPAAVTGEPHSSAPPPPPPSSGAMTMAIPLVAPCLMAHDLSRVVKLEVNSPRYFSLCLWPQEFGSHAAALQSLTLYVKRKHGHLSYAADPLGPRSVHSPTSPLSPSTPKAAASSATTEGAAAAAVAAPSPLSAWAPDLGTERLAEDPTLAAWAQFLVANAASSGEDSAKSGATSLVAGNKESLALGAVTNTCRSALTRAVGLACTDALPLLTSFGQSAAYLARAAKVLNCTSSTNGAAEWQAAQKWLRHANLNSAGAWDLAAVAQFTSALAHVTHHGSLASSDSLDSGSSNSICENAVAPASDTAIILQRQRQEALEPILAAEQVAGVHLDLNSIFQALGLFTQRGSGGAPSPVAHYLRTGRYDAHNLLEAQRPCLAACLALGRFPSHHQLQAAGFLDQTKGRVSVLRLAKAFPGTPMDTLVRVRQELR